MKPTINHRGKLPLIISFMIFFIGIHLYSSGQGITVYQYRHVAAENVGEFIERETTYWSKVAENAMEDGNLTFWALLEKMGGYDLPNSSNYLFVNTYNDIDAIGEVWDPSSVFPDVSIDLMETGSLSTVTSTFFLQEGSWEQDEEAQPDDFGYLVMVYHNSPAPDSLIQLENEHWGPFIRKAMKNNQTTQVGWGNAIVLSPSGEHINFNTVSYDLYPNLKEALNPTWDENIVFPEEGLEAIGELELNRRGSVVYRIVQVVEPPEE